MILWLEKKKLKIWDSRNFIYDSKQTITLVEKYKEKKKPKLVS